VSVVYLYTSILADLDIVNEIAFSYNNTSTFVTTNERKLGCQWPISIDSVEIGVADTRVLDVDQNLVWTWFLDWDLLIDDGCKGCQFKTSGFSWGNILRCPVFSTTWAHCSVGICDEDILMVFILSFWFWFKGCF
jgi:hypothetical protein